MNGFDLSTISGIFVGSEKYSAIYKGSTLIFRDYSAEYLTFESLEDNNVIGLQAYSANTPTKTIEYSTNKVNWTSATSSQAGTTLATLNTGDKLYLRGTNIQYNTYVNSVHEYNRFTSTKTFNVYGNIMSLINASTFKTLMSFSTTNVFTYLFFQSKVVDASNLILPVTTFNQATLYNRMFQECTSLIAAPILPATTLSTNCYYAMFVGCTALVTPPALPATTLANSCYQSMFQGCTSLTSVPTLPATTMKASCYRSMFQGCTSLTTIPSDYLPFTTLATNCYRSMFQDCTNITTAPDLPAATLVQACYRAMFFGCSKLNYIKMLATDISATECLYAWVNTVASSGTFIKHPDMTSLPTGTSGIPTGWTVYSSDADYYKNEYLTIESLEDNNSISFKTSNSSLTPTIQYSIDKTNWTSATSTTSGVTLTILNTGDKLYLKGDNNQYSLGSSQESNISSTKTVNIYGNILSLYNSTSYNTVTSISSASNYLFRALFKGLKIIDASNLILPIANKAGCYIYLFYNCTSLTTAPALPATTLGNYCYMGMFQGCTSLTTAPALPATTLVSQCYSYMFNGCSKLNYIKMLATDISATKCLENWTSNVASSGTFVKHPNTTIPSGTSGIPSNWTVQTESS